MWKSANSSAADPEWWREVYLLQVAQLRQKLGTAIGFVNTLCPAGAPAQRPAAESDWQSAVLAGQAMVELRLPDENSSQTTSR